MENFQEGFYSFHNSVSILGSGGDYWCIRISIQVIGVKVLFIGEDYVGNIELVQSSQDFLVSGGYSLAVVHNQYGSIQAFGDYPPHEAEAVLAWGSEEVHFFFR